MAFPASVIVASNEPRPSGSGSRARLSERGESNSSDGDPTTMVCCPLLCCCYHLRDWLMWRAAAAAAAAADAPVPSCSPSAHRTISVKRDGRNTQRVRHANIDLNACRHRIPASRNEVGEDEPPRVFV